MVEGTVIVEVKSIERLAQVHPKQLLTYLRLTNLRVGLLLNVGTAVMKEGIMRVVNDLRHTSFDANPKASRLRSWMERSGAQIATPTAVLRVLRASA